MNKIKALDVKHYVEGKLHVLSSQVETIAKWPESKNVKGVWEFLRAIRITHWWVKNFTEIVRLLNCLTDNVLWRWTQLKQLSFEILQIKCVTKVAMHGIDWSLVIHVYTDASGFTEGLVITQFQVVEGFKKSVKVSIIYDALTFSITEQKYQIYKWELCAMMKFIFKFQYLLCTSDCQVIIHTDHKLLIHFLNSSLHDRIYDHWAVKLQGLNIKIVHIKGSRNVIADDLSQTIFFKKDCEEDNTVHLTLDNLHWEGAQWIWKNDKDEFETFLKGLTDDEQTEVVSKRSLNNISVFALQSSMSWWEMYESSAWFMTVYHYIITDDLSTPISA